MIALIHVKILGTKKPQRYAVWRAVVAAWDELLHEHPEPDLKIVEVKDLQEIQNYTQVFIYPSLVINEQLVCVGRFPRKGEILGWFQQALPPDAQESENEDHSKEEITK